MLPRCLFGPVTRAYADQKLHAARLRRECIAFDIRDGSDLTIGLGDSWADVCARLPPGWQPDFIALYLPYQSIPACLWSAPVPVVGLAADWNLLWHWYRRCLAACDLVLTDIVGVETLARQGIHHSRIANLCGCERVYLESPPSAPDRDIDVLFVGNFNPAVQRERLPWLSRLAAFADRWKVVLATGVFDDDYRTLLARARIVFNRSIRGQCNMRTFEATAAGALLFQEAENREVGNYLQDRKEFVAYRSEDFEDLLSYYLEHEVARHRVADAGRRRAQEYGFAQLWDETLKRSFDIAGGGSTSNLLSGQAGKRQVPGDTNALLMRCWERAQTTREVDTTLAADLEKALAANQSCAALHHALAVTLAHQAKWSQSAEWSPIVHGLREDWSPPIVHSLREALKHDPTHVMASLNLAEVFSFSGQPTLAVEQARQTLALLERSPRLSPEALDAPHIPVAFDQFHVEWERSAWSNAGNPAEESVAKQSLLRWRLHSMLGSLTGDVGHWYQAVFAQPDLPTSRAAVGLSHAQAGNFSEAVPFLARAVSDNPLDAVTSRVYFVALSHCRDTTGQRRRLARDRRLLAEAAPTIVAKEAWFMDERPVGDELASVIILCCNQLDITRQCLDSVSLYTRSPYELILVDNGSTDGTAAYLEEMQKRASPARLVVIRNNTNRGFAAGVNQGLKNSRGRYLVLLNNDTIVTPGWLDGLIAWSHHEWPRVGIVGPMTNCASPPQEIPTSYSTVQEMLAFAAHRRQAFAGQAATVLRLVGFCMLIPREVWDKVGDLDEGFGIGFFEVDDLCVRVREAGFQLVMANDVFIHHRGNCTFQGLEIDVTAQLQTNFQRFRAKWGDQHCANYELRIRTEGGGKSE